MIINKIFYEEAPITQWWFLCGSSRKSAKFLSGEFQIFARAKSIWLHRSSDVLADFFAVCTLKPYFIVWKKHM